MAPLVSVLFITYRRFNLLERSVQSFLTNTSYPNLEIIVADDGSPVEIQQKIRYLPVDKVILSKRNRGLGANANAGLRECNGEYVLSLQDDWECHGPDSYLREAVDAMQSHTHIGLIRFYGVQEAVDTVRMIDRGRDLFEIESPTQKTDANRHVYSDTPHLKSKAMMDYVGKYDASLPMEECERNYQDRFLGQGQFTAAYFPKYMNSVFIHIGAAQSLRTNSPRARFERRLHFALRPIRDQGGPVYGILRRYYRAGVRLLYGAGVIR